MDRIEIVDPGANGEAGFSIESKKWPAVEERVIMLSTAGTEYTLSKPSLCPYYGDHLREMKKVAIVTFWSFVAQGHAKQLREVLGDEVSILCYSFDSYEFKEVIDADLVVFSLFSIYLGIKKYISSRAKVVIVTLTLNNAQYQKVLDIPRGEKVMVVNYSSDMAMETIALFNQLGLDHLEYVPVYPGLTTIPKIKIAVTPGESHLIPEGVETIIDIHQRVLDTQTLADVLVKLGMENLLYSRAFIAHADSLLSYRAGVELLLGKTDTLQSEFISLLNVLEQGILAVNDQLFVHALNRKAQEILGSTTEEAVGRRYTELVPEFQFERVITSAEPIRKVLLSVQGEELSVTIVPVVNARKVSGAIARYNRKLCMKGMSVSYVVSPNSTWTLEGPEGYAHEEDYRKTGRRSNDFGIAGGLGRNRPAGSAADAPGGLGA